MTIPCPSTSSSNLSCASCSSSRAENAPRYGRAKKLRRKAFDLQARRTSGRRRTEKRPDYSPVRKKWGLSRTFFSPDSGGSVNGAFFYARNPVDRKPAGFLCIITATSSWQRTRARSRPGPRACRSWRPPSRSAGPPRRSCPPRWHGCPRGTCAGAYPRDPCSPAGPAW